MIEFFKKVILNFKERIHETNEKKLIIQSKILSEKNKDKEKLDNLSDVEYSVFSQWGEDGIINWIISQEVQINDYFIEFGTGDYKESNTRYLLQNSNWSGSLIEGNKNDYNKIVNWKKRWRYDINIKNEFITKKNINDLIKSFNPPKNIGLLSIDIDGNDYWILKEINLNELNPSIIIVEYNSLFGDKHKITVPYDENFDRSKKSHTNLYFGCSIKALINLCEEKKYFFVGTNKNGCNAFFVNKELFENLNDKITNKRIFLSKFMESRNQEKKLSFLKRKDQLDLVKHLEVFDIEENNTRKISEYHDL